MFCCCAKTRKDGDSDSITGFEGRYKSLQMLLLEFIKEENSLKMKDIELADLTYKLYQITLSEKSELPKKDAMNLY